MKALLRLLLPRWRFFEAIGNTYLVYYRTEEGKPWQLLTEKKHRHLHQVLWNPEGNYRHAFQSCMEQLAMEIPHQEDVQKISQLATIQSLIRDEIFLRHGACHYQFKIVTLLQGEAKINEKDLLISSWEQSL